MENGIQSKPKQSINKGNLALAITTAVLTFGLGVLVYLFSPACNGVVIGGVRYDIRADYVSASCENDISIGDIEILSELDGLPVGHISINEFGNEPPCTSITSIKFQRNYIDDGQRNNMIAYTINCSGCTSLETVEFPETCMRFLFDNCPSLRSIEIPSTLSYMPSFENCTSLTSINIPDGVTKIGDSTFSGCTSLTSIDIPDSVTSIGESAFSGCTSLTSIDIPDSVTKIGKSAFSGCTSLTSVNISDGVTTIEPYTFGGCTSLTSISIPYSVTELNGSILGLGAFTGCTSLSSVYIPNSVTAIGAFTFADCTSLESVYVPDSVTYLDGTAFSLCDRLTSVSVPSHTNITQSSHYTDEAYLWMNAVDLR